MLLHRAPQPKMASTTCKHQTSHASNSTAPPPRSVTAPTLCTHQDSRFSPPPATGAAAGDGGIRRIAGGEVDLTGGGGQKFAFYCSRRGGSPRYLG
jgi:hypothetical protein